jgi:hypothetical protein
VREREPLTAEDIVANPALVADVEPAAVAQILARLATVTAALAARMPVLAPSNAPETQRSDRLLSAKEAAEVLHVSVDFLRRSPTIRPLRVHVGRELRFSSVAIQTYIRRQAGRE